MRQFTELKKRYPNDPALAYAIDVVTGKVLAGEKMKQACKRHINDLKRIEDDDDFIYVYDVDEAQKIIEFATLLKDVSSGEQFNPSPYQRFIFAVIQGWRNLKPKECALRISLSQWHEQMVRLNCYLPMRYTISYLAFQR